MSDIAAIMARAQARRRAITEPERPLNPWAAQPGYLGGFVESALSSLPEMIGTDPTPGAVEFRAQNPVSGFASQVLPALIPYGGMYKLSTTAAGQKALSKGMGFVKSSGRALGMSVDNRPIIGAAVKEMLRYSPLELGRLGVGAIVNPENTGELFADVALSTAFAGGFGGLGGYLRVGGKRSRDVGGSPIEGQENMFAHPVVDLRASLQPEAKTVADEISLEAAQSQLVKAVLNDAPEKGFISKKIVPLVTAIESGTEKTVAAINAMLKPNSRGAKNRAVDRRKLWEGDANDNITLNPGELDPVVKGLGFSTPTELAENVLTARLITINNDRALGTFKSWIDDPAIVKVGDDAFMARTNTGSTFVLKRLNAAPVEKLDGATAPPSPADEALAAVELPDVDAKALDDAGWTTSEVRNWQQGKADSVRIDQVKQGYIFRGGDMVPASDEIVEATRRMADQRIAGLKDKIRLFEASPEKLFKPFGDAKALPKADAIDVLNRAIDTEMEMVNKAMRQNERWRFSQNAPVPKPAPKRARKNSRQVLPPRAEAPFQAGDRWVAVLTDRPGAFIRDLEKLNATNKQQWSIFRRMFQPMAHEAHVFNQADDLLLRTLSPLDVARMGRQSRKTWVAETAKALGRKGLTEAGLDNSFALQNYADHLYDLFAPAMFKERRNSLYARFSGLLSNRLRVVNERVNEAMYGREGLKSGARGTLGRNFERQRINGEMSFRETVAQLTDDELDVVVKALVSKTPAKEIKKLAADGVISENAFRAVERMQSINAGFMTDTVLPALKSLGEKGNFDLLEGYVIPRILLGDWRMPVTDAQGRLVYLASGKTRGAAEQMAKAVVAEAKDRGVQYAADKSYLKHAVEMNLDDITDLMEDVGRRIDSDPDAADIVASAMKRVQFMNVKRQSRLPYQPRTPGSLAHERTGVRGTDTTYTREEFIKAFEAHIRKMGNFAAVHSYMERWGNEVMALKGQNEVLYNDVMRRAQQAMGVEGQITKTLNNILTPFFGSALGSKAATKIAAATNKTLYAWQLAFVNPTFALLNALSPIQTVLPQLAFVLRAPSVEANRLLHHVPLFGADGKPIGHGAFLDTIKLLWESVRQLRHADEELQHIHVRLRNDNTLHPMLFEEHTGAGASNPQTLKESFQSGGWAQFLIDGSTIMARKSEEFARIVSANAGYLVGKHHLRLEGEQLYHFTKRFIESTNYLYGQSDRARLITGPVGSMFGLFKNWQMHFMGMMATYAGLAIKHNVYAPLMWQSAAAMTLGGMGATPLRHLADGLSNWHDSTPDSYLWMQENWGETAADVTYFGPMAGLGVSLQASSSIPGTDVRNEIQSFFNSVVLERMKQLGKATGEAWTYHSATGENPFTNSNIRDQFLAAAAPRAVSRASSVVEGEYVRSMGTGYPQVQDVSFAGRLVHGMGLNAVEIERHQVAARRLWKEQEARKAQTTYHGKAYSEAIAVQDYEQADRILTSAIALELDVSSVMRSSDNYRRREEGDLLARYKTESSARYRAAFGQ